MSIPILLVDNNRAFSHALSALLAEHHDFGVVGSVSDGNQAVESARRLNPGIVIMDPNFPVRHGITTAAALVRQDPRVRILMLSQKLPWEESGEPAVSFLSVGIFGYLLKHEIASVPDAIRRVHRGHGVFHPELQTRIMTELTRRPAGRRRRV